MCFFHCTRKINDRKKGKNKRLNKTDKNTQKQDRQRGQIETRQAEQDADNLLFAEDIAEQPYT